MPGRGVDAHAAGARSLNIGSANRLLNLRTAPPYDRRQRHAVKQLTLRTRDYLWFHQLPTYGFITGSGSSGVSGVVTAVMPYTAALLKISMAVFSNIHSSSAV